MFSCIYKPKIKTDIQVSYNSEKCVISLDLNNKKVQKAEIFFEKTKIKSPLIKKYLK